MPISAQIFRYAALQIGEPAKFESKARLVSVCQKGRKVLTSGSDNVRRNSASAFLGLCGAAILIALAAGCGGNGGSSGSAAQGLWLPNYGGNTITEFTGSKLTKSGTPSATVTNKSADLSEPWAIAFDKKHDLWSTNYENDTITEYTASQLGSLHSKPAPTAKVVISEPSSGPSGLQFDESGNLWVAYSSTAELVEFKPSQLTASGSPTPTITVTSPSLYAPSAIEFDKSGNLWVADAGGSDVLEFTASQLAAGGSQTPNLTLATTTIGYDYAIAFDKSGNLWVTNFEADTVLEFAASSLTGSGTITPAATATIIATTVTTATGSADSLDGPDGLAFDKSGDLWVSNWTSDYYGSLAEFTAKQLAAAGSAAADGHASAQAVTSVSGITPNVFLDSDTAGSNIRNPILIAFGPSVR